MEVILEHQYQTLLWEVGDLCHFPTGFVLCVGAGHTFAFFITAEGMPFGDIQVLDIPKNAHFLHNTGLRYVYQDREQLIRDYKAGYFTPYFNRL